ncbi:MAG: maltose alpha-D-glucosyltransferase [Thermomicrobiales bacterium]|nr:maltose alpha-D-glucosyltransferase [Thermomicrobiales bacterium]
MSNDPTWYKDAVFYEVSIAAFADGNSDGVGDFPGLTSRLDYLADLGIDCIWLLPMYPSPLKDGGYDIMNFTDIDPRFGTMDDFRAFIAAAHERGIRVIADLVLNHCSDQHPWFQEARLDRNSRYRDYFVWSDDDHRYADARVIFTDTERSNWTYDPVAGQYYWHRFFAHQPDLNYDNPDLRQAMLDVARFWLDEGLDGFRCDAVPYVYEREGTSCENLPETHTLLCDLRAAIDHEYPGRGVVLLGEANQWPADVIKYFGTATASEFHMSFHFPLMPRLFLALANADRTPVIDILEHTPAVRSDCQWAIFLRNHDELTLEMLEHADRERLWEVYGSEPHMPLNLGIRRRLAPLMGHDERRIRLMMSLLFSMPGSPVLYYGDEIGMGDDLSLPDRDGVRTAMQWDSSPHGGFTTGDPVTPVIEHGAFRPELVNVERQLGAKGSLLEWSTQLIRLNGERRAFGRGRLQFIYPPGRSVLAYLRDFEGESILCLANLSGEPVVACPNLSRFAGRRPVDLIHDAPYNEIGNDPYPVHLEPYEFVWLQIAPARVETTDADLVDRTNMSELMTATV